METESRRHSDAEQAPSTTYTLLPQINLQTHEYVMTSLQEDSTTEDLEFQHTDAVDNVEMASYNTDDFDDVNNKQHLQPHDFTRSRFETNSTELYETLKLSPQKRNSLTSLTMNEVRRQAQVRRMSLEHNNRLPSLGHGRRDSLGEMARKKTRSTSLSKII